MGGESPLPPVLVVDDEKSICDAIAHILKGAGYGVTTAFSGAEGIKLIENVGYDLVISDYHLGTGANGAFATGSGSAVHLARVSITASVPKTINR